MAGTGSMDAQIASLDDAILVFLAAGEHEYMFVALVMVKRNPGRLAKSKQCRRRPGDPVAVKAMNIHAIAKWAPRQSVGMSGQLQEIPHL